MLVVTRLAPRLGVVRQRGCFPSALRSRLPGEARSYGRLHAWRRLAGPTCWMFLVACEVSSGAVIADGPLSISRIAIVRRRYACTCRQAWRVFDDGNQRSADRSADPHQAVGQSTDAGAGRIRQSAPTSAGAQQPFCRNISVASAFGNNAAVGRPTCQDVQVMGADI